jgi:thymidine kinase
MKGELVLILGCMFAGKTETLLAKAHRYLIAKKKIVLIKYRGDNRYSVQDICSHSAKSMKATFAVDKLKDVDEKSIADADVILIDEGQFFPDLELADNWAKDKTVIISALKSDWKKEPFPSIAKIIPCVDELIPLRAICSQCGEEASHTKKMVPSQETILIGGSESYQPRCRRCFYLNE